MFKIRVCSKYFKDEDYYFFDCVGRFLFKEGVILIVFNWVVVLKFRCEIIRYIKRCVEFENLIKVVL